MEIKMLTPGRPTPIQIGQAVLLKFLPCYPNGEVLDVTTLTNILIQVGGAKTTYAHTIQGQYICITLPATEVEGVYDVFMSATIGTNPVACAWNDLYSRVKYSNGISYDTYETRLVIVQTTDAQLEAAKAATEAARLSYLASKSQYDTAKAALIEQALQLQGVAQDATVAKASALTTATAAILQAISEIEIDIPEGIAMEAQATLNKEAILQAIAAITSGLTTEDKAWLLQQFAAITIDTSTLATKAAQTAQTGQLTTLQQRLDVADSYSVEEYPVSDCTTMAQNHIKAVYGEVSDTTAPDRYKARAQVLFTTEPNASPITGTVLNLQRNLAYGLSRKSITLQHGSTTFTTDIPDTGYGFTELWRKEGNAWKHYVKNPTAATDGNIDTLKPTLESVSGGVTTYNDIICLTDPATIN